MNSLPSHPKTIQKLCARCNTIKPSEMFYRQAGAKKDGLSGYCKACCREWARENSDKRKIIAARYYQKDPEKMRERARLIREKDPALHRSRVYSYRARNREKVLGAKAEYNATHKAEIRAYRVRVKEHSKAYQREYAEKNPHILRARTARYRSRKRKAMQGDQQQVSAFYAAASAAPRLPCYWCGKRTKQDDRHIDHIVSLLKGGPHSVENLCVSCAACNMLKRDTDPNIFSSQGVILFPTPIATPV